MASIQITSHITVDELLQSVEQLSTSDLEKIVQHILTLRARRNVSHLSAEESDLLLKINQPIEASVQEKYNELWAKKENDDLSADEHQELLSLIEKIELADAQRVLHLGELANLRGLSIDELKKDLGITKASYV
ncbi:MAG TPA: STAS/SEC14 domain-containing protein [Anaerolineae bacterium]|nr:STAS/SEC14 domain-containing protein [Anaerolineae bacterium]